MMDPLDLTQSFIERCERSVPTPELAAAFQNAVEQLGFRHFACCSHVNPVHPLKNAVLLHSYPAAWARAYVEQKLHEFDPVFLYAEKQILPFHWDAPGFRVDLTASQERILVDAASHGVARGYTVPIHLPWAAGALRASCSVIPDAHAVDGRAYRAVQLMAMYLYASASGQSEWKTAQAVESRARPMLSARERQCLELAACGKSDWEISQLLRISEHTVHKHVEAAKRRLGVATRIQAIVWAAQRREICLGDVVTAVPSGERTPSIAMITEKTAGGQGRRVSVPHGCGSKR